MMDAIRTEDLSKKFGNLTAVDRLSLTVAQGEIFGLVGPDGAGKTTTMRLLTGIMEPASGDAYILDKHIVRDAEAIKEETGYMSQRFGLYPDLTVMENIHFYADIYGVPAKGRENQLERLLAFSNLIPFKKRYAKNLSGGMKQKLGLVCALIHTPKILFLDEPTNGVDPVSRRDFWRILYELLKENVTIFVSTAYLDEADRCHRVALLDKGKLLACDTPAGLRRLMHGDILEVQTAEARKGSSLLRQRLHGLTVGLFGDRIHIVTEDATATSRSVENIFREQHIDLQSVRTIEPSLEDIFVSVISEKRRETA